MININNLYKQSLGPQILRVRNSLETKTSEHHRSMVQQAFSVRATWESLGSAGPPATRSVLHLLASALNAAIPGTWA